ncbi:MAG: hypothetical protein A2729_03915 [Candidatus Buchananbacteria bacterium RIFCSPHIGHO2_01_FULL_39_14]|uniref:Uncharacterized protein n=2 Tax=Candidatus Buchananiibacteriota TaxID=1817903 RepID=A0A1G1YUX4_9BACT|nr:MAG: hypothetical protein A2729_03915 [Candidatus Buchananbacteria bacterium RIFCSPHIGHO2_01_FULL_39_14]OGY48614.1 MAG: hypothetical protein A3D39_05110 [Candidatus Buchananbacteria bacterium RIFCSPHIGHO2_02_FULL_39_17]OGY56039.1 MAG: hypothetical protein A2912_03490 [Candidatus Buchananbacteria bacterium RIFCSPLOWO2_01_FULL_40_23b]
MTDERWQEIIGQIKDKFQISDQRTEDLPEERGRGSVEIVEFIGPLGRMKLERTTQPLVLGKKTIGSRRIGSQTTVKYLYSESEKIHKFKAYRFDENNNEWLEIKMERKEMIF